MINVNITVNTVINENTPDEYVVNGTYTGKYIYSKDESRIAYDELTDGGAVHCRIIIKKGKGEIDRRGAVGCTIPLVPGKTAEFDYGTQFGTMKMTSLCHSLKADLKKDGGTIDTSYELFSAGKNLSKNKITLTIKKI